MTLRLHKQNFHLRSAVLRQVFARFDKDNSGEIDREELKAVFAGNHRSAWICIVWAVCSQVIVVFMRMRDHIPTKAAEVKHITEHIDTKFS